MIKVSKLLEELDAQMRQGSATGITVRRLGAHISDSVIAVDIAMRCPTGRTQLPDLVQKQNEENLLERGEVFYRDQVSKASIALIPKELRNNIVKIEKSIRRRKDELCIAKDYMPTDAFPRFQQDFEQARKEFFAARDRIIDNWDSIKDSYEIGVRDMLENIQMPDFMREKIFGNLIAAIPQKEQFAEGFSMTMQVYAFPSEPNHPGINSSIADALTDTWKDDVVSTAILAIERSIGDGWERLNAAMKQYLQHATIRSNTIDTIVRYAQNMSFKNVFSNKLLTELAKTLSGLTSMTTEQQASQIEDCIVMVYQYAQEAQIDLNMDVSSYTIEDLEIMSQTAA